MMRIATWIACVWLVGAWSFATGQSMPTTQPVDDYAMLRVREEGGTLAVTQTSFKSGYDPATDTIWSAAWQDTFLWRPGYSWAAIYGWEVSHLSDDGRWVLLYRNGDKPKLVSVYSLLANNRQVTMLQADVTRDGKVDQADFGVLQTQLGRIGPWSGDLNRDGWVDAADVDLFELVRQQMQR